MNFNTVYRNIALLCSLQHQSASLYSAVLGFTNVLQHQGTIGLMLYLWFLKLSTTFSIIKNKAGQIVYSTPCHTYV